jgi:hypothetical protein
LNGRYVVTGTRRYRGHDPGSIFEVRLEPVVEARAVARGHIRVIDRFLPRPGLHTFPRGWLAADPSANEGRESGLSHSRR